MKVRWNRTSLRLRVTPAELAALGEGRSVREEIVFPGAETAGWSITLRPGSLRTCLVPQDGAVLLMLGDAGCRTLQLPDQEGIYFPVDSEQSSEPPFRYFIEKDFPCVHPRALEAMEAPSETFPAPAGFEERK